ncbi:hypothetical protein WME91_45395 [Sorangium sp. So ce269]
MIVSGYCSGKLDVSRPGGTLVSNGGQDIFLLKLDRIGACPGAARI